MMSNWRGVRVRILASLLSIGLLAGGVLLSASMVHAQQRQQQKQGKGSVRNSSAANKRGKVATTPATPRTRAIGRGGARGARGGARAGARTGYRRGRYHGWNDARRSWRRWRVFRGTVVLGMYFATRPKQTTTVVVTGTTYHYSGGVYYVQSGSGYVVVSAPPGAVVYAVPTYTTVVYVGTTEYLYCDGAYYTTTTAPAEQPPPPGPSATEVASTEDGDPSEIPMTDDDDNYEVLAPPVGATVPYLPDDADEETVEGKKYFVYDGTYYRPFASDEETIYMVVEDPR